MAIAPSIHAIVRETGVEQLADQHVVVHAAAVSAVVYVTGWPRRRRPECSEGHHAKGVVFHIDARLRRVHAAAG